MSSLDLENVTLHNATIHSRAPLTVETGTGQWDYAISLHLALCDYAPRIERLPVQISAQVTVRSGALGCLLVDDDWTTLLGRMPATITAGRHTVDLVWERAAPEARLVFRNHGGGGEACLFSVDALRIRPLDCDPFVYVSRLNDVLQPGGHRLDLTRLRDAVLHPEVLWHDDKAVLDHLRNTRRVIQGTTAGGRCEDASYLRQLPSGELRDRWLSAYREATTGVGCRTTGWHHGLYRDALRGKKVLDVGDGLRIDGIEFARHGACLTFVDIVEENLTLLRRLCDAFDIDDASFVYLERLSSLDVLEDDYDVVWCQDSQVHHPFTFAKLECAALLQHLKAGGRWIEVAYPKERWVREGRPRYRSWGAMSDLEGPRWVEWYDLDKLRRRLAPVQFAPVLVVNREDQAFHWFDLLRESK